MVLFDFIYSLFIVISIPLWIKFIFKRKYSSIFKRRISPDIKPGIKKRIWIHAVSVGEVKSIKNLIERLNTKFNKEIVLSVTTPSGYEFAKKEYSRIKVINAPFDLSFIIKKFIKKIDPEILILNELEIWPNWILITKKFKIPILLINGRISEIAFKKYKMFSFFLKQFFNKIDFFLVQAEIFKKRFVQLQISDQKIDVCGNIKADEAANALNNLPSEHEIFEFLKIKDNNKKIVTLASSHSSDEKMVIPEIKKLGSKFSFIIVPRHLGRVDEIEKTLKNQNIQYTTWSKTKKIDLAENVMIFDKMGYLFNLLRITDIVIMGGTFDKKIGGHNLYEPAALGKLIVGGPYYNNFPDIGRELSENGVYNIINSHDEFLQFFRNFNNFDLKRVQSEAFNSMMRRKGSTECILKEIQKLINF